MKSLQTIQKTFRIFQILTKIAMILSFVWAGLAALGMLCGIVWQSGGTVIGADRELMLFLTGTGRLTEMNGILLTDTVLALTDGILFTFALRYFKAEQADGTPFTHSGAEQIKRLGILTVALPLAAVILSAIVCAVFGLPHDAAGDRGDLTSAATGIVLILASLIFRYGAELEEKRI